MAVDADYSAPGAGGRATEGSGAVGPLSTDRRAAFALLGSVQVTLIFTITLIAVPLPVIGAELGLDSSELVVTSAAYGLSFSGLLLLGGRLADRRGARRVFVAGLVLFAGASAAAPAASGFVTLAAARFGQGIGAALVAPSAMVLLRTLFAEVGEYQRAMATWGGLSVLGATAGIVLSGSVTAVVSWRWMFAIPVLVAATAFVLTPRLLPSVRPATRGPLDLPGAVLSTAGVTLLSYGLVMTGDRVWSSTAVAAPLALGAALLAGFVVVESRGRDPLLPPAFLAHPRRSAALAVIGMSAAATAVVCLFLALYLQQVRGWSALQTSLAFIPYAIALVVGGRLAGALVQRVGGTAVIVAGLALAAGGLLLLVPLDLHTRYAVGLLPALVVLPAGVALTFAGAAVLAVADVPASRLGLAGGVMNTAMELGPTAILALISALASAQTKASISTVDPMTATARGYGAGFAATGLALALLAVVIAIAAIRRRSRRSRSRAASSFPTTP